MAASGQTANPSASHLNERDEIARQVRDASTSFYGAMRILPRARREAIFAVYAFCRTVDDIADEEALAVGERIRQLARWREEIAALYAGKPTNTISRALVAPTAEFGLNQADFIAVIDGMEMDASGPIVAPLEAELHLYCDRVACAVGRLCICVFGEPGENGRDVAAHLGLALQLTNILRDVDEDAGLGRLYLPKEMLAAHGIPATHPAQVTTHPAYPALWRELAARARNAFRAADAALLRCDRRRMRPARIMMEVYRRNLDRMMALTDQQLADPAQSKRLVSKLEKIRIALRYGLL